MRPSRSSSVYIFKIFSETTQQTSKDGGARVSPNGSDQCYNDSRHAHFDKWAAAWDFQQCGMCDQQRLRPACAYAKSDQSLCLSLDYSTSVKLLTEHHLQAAQTRLSIHLSKCHIVGNHMSRLKYHLNPCPEPEGYVVLRMTILGWHWSS